MPDGVDVHQLNCTYYSALDGDDERYLAARAIQLFAQGRAAGLLRRAARGRERPSRPSSGPARAARSTGTTTRLDEIERRAPAARWCSGSSTSSGFGTPTRRSTATMCVESDDRHSFRLHWRIDGKAALSLEIDLVAGEAAVVDQDGRMPIADWVA